MNHTPEPWHIRKVERSFLLSEDSFWNKFTYVLCGAPGSMFEPGLIYNDGTENAGLAKVNATRIVDCVNACKGMANPTLQISRLTRSVTLLLEMVRPDIQAALASDNVGEEEKAMLRGQLEYCENTLKTI